MNFEYLVHYGTPRHSGRYPWGSGDRPYQSLKASRAQRSVEESATAKRLAARYVNAMDKKAKDRRSKYEAGKRGYSENRAIRAEQELEVGKKFANKYLKGFDKKVADRKRMEERLIKGKEEVEKLLSTKKKTIAIY